MTTWHTQDPRAFTSTHLDPRFYAPRSLPPTSPAKSVCGSSSSRSSGGRQRAKVSCSYCRLRKIRCDGGVVCSSCTRTKRSCEYKEVSDEDNRAARERKAFLKAQKVATGFAGRSPRGGMNESSSCPDLLLEGWQPKREASSSSPPQPIYEPSSSRPFPSVLLSSPLAFDTLLLASPEFTPPYDGQQPPSSSYTSYFPSSTSTPNLSSSNFSTPPPSPLHPTFARFDDVPESSWIIPPNPAFRTPTNYPHTSLDLSTSPLGPGSNIPLPKAGLEGAFDFEELELADASTSTITPLAESSFIPQIDFGASTPLMGDLWVFDPSWEAEGEQALQGWVV